MPHSSEINLLEYQHLLQIGEKEGRKKIYDSIRKKWYVLTPEEYVRQLVLAHLTTTLAYPMGRIAVEKQLIINEMKKRFDIVIYDEHASPYILIECKAPRETINERTAMQIATYNQSLKATFLWLTNGADNLYFEMDYEGTLAKSIGSLPSYRS